MSSGYNLILVDDEPIIREGISGQIPWGMNGFNLVGDFEHGAAALEFLKANPVDLVITDINMPRMNGLELSKLINIEQPETAVVLLTGYNEFEYAQEAIKYRVKDFILKPITAEELNNTLGKLKLEFDFIRGERRKIEHLRKQACQGQRILKEKYLFDLLHGSIQEGNSCQDEYYQVGSLLLQNRISEAAQTELLHHSKTLLQNPEEVLFFESRIVFILQHTSESALKKRVSVLSDQIKQSSPYKDAQITWGTLVKGTKNLASSYQGILDVEALNSILGTEYRFAVDILKLEEVDWQKVITSLDTLFDQIISIDSAQACVQIAELQEILLHRKTGKHHLDLLYYSFNRRMTEVSAMVDGFSEVCLGHREEWESLDGLFQYFIKVIERYYIEVDTTRNSKRTKKVNEIKDIIEANFRNRFLSLGDVAQMSGLSVSQFSLLFKQEVGISFIEYLTKLRVTAAQHLLRTTDLLIYEIAEEVGYSDPRYFSQVFRRYSGDTPIDFRSRGLLVK